MFGMSWGEMILVVLVILVVFGPEKIPQMARKAGQTIRMMRQMMAEFEQSLTLPADDQNDEQKQLVQVQTPQKISHQEMLLQWKAYLEEPLIEITPVPLKNAQTSTEIQSIPLSPTKKV